MAELSEFPSALSLAELSASLRRSTLFVAICGISVGAIFAVGTFFTVSVSDRTTTVRVQFSFPGAEKRRYEDGRMFLASDLVSAKIVDEAASHLNIQDSRIISDIRLGLSLVPLLPENEKNSVIEPTVYDLGLKIRASDRLDQQERVQFLNALVSEYQNQLIRNFVKQPTELSDPFKGVNLDTLFEAAYTLPIKFDILERFVQLRQTSSELSFDDKQRWRDWLAAVNDFRRLRLSRALAAVDALPLSEAPSVFLKSVQFEITYQQLRQQQFVAEQQQFSELMHRVESATRSYVPVQSDRSMPVIDPSLLNGLLEHDAYSKLVSDERGLVSELTDTQRQIAMLNGLITRPNVSNNPDHTLKPASALQELDEAQKAFAPILTAIQYAYNNEQSRFYENSARFSGKPRSDNPLRTCLLLTSVGFFIGLAFGASLVGLRIAFQHKDFTLQQ